jgi:hypothetical protein
MAPKPSETLTALSNTLPPETYRTLLERYIYPALDKLPTSQRSKLETNLTRIQDDYARQAALINNIGYENAQKQFESQLKAIKRHVKRDRDGWEIQVREIRVKVQTIHE